MLLILLWKLSAAQFLRPFWRKRIFLKSPFRNPAMGWWSTLGFEEFALFMIPDRSFPI
jgi:hypothetical protein